MVQLSLISSDVSESLLLLSDIAFEDINFTFKLNIIDLLLKMLIIMLKTITIGIVLLKL